MKRPAPPLESLKLFLVKWSGYVSFEKVVVATDEAEVDENFDAADIDGADLHVEVEELDPTEERDVLEAHVAAAHGSVWVPGHDWVPVDRLVKILAEARLPNDAQPFRFCKEFKEAQVPLFAGVTPNPIPIPIEEEEEP